MERKTVSGIMVALLLIVMLTLAFDIQPVKASGTIYIRPNGSVDPPDAPISTVDNITYYFTDNIYNSIVVQRSNITIDGAGYTLQGGGGGTGFRLSSINNVKIKGTNIQRFFAGVSLNSSSYNTLSENTITNIGWGGGVVLSSGSSYNTIYGNNIIANVYLGVVLGGFSDNNNIFANNITKNSGGGVYIELSFNNIFFGNDITNNLFGFYLSVSRHNIIAGNNIINNDVGLGVSFSSDDSIYHNNVIDNQRQVSDGTGAIAWDDGYPSGGNYWSNYPGVDLYSGPYQNETGSDGIGDTPHVIGGTKKDRYPLMRPWGEEAHEEGIPFWMLWWFWIIMAVGFGVVAGAVYYLKKRKRPASPLLPSEGTDSIRVIDR